MLHAVYIYVLVAETARRHPSLIQVEILLRGRVVTALMHIHEMAQDFQKLRNDAASAIADLTNRSAIPKQFELSRPKSIQVGSLTIPALSAGTRQVVATATGALRYPTSAIVAFFTGATSTSSIQNQMVLPGQTGSGAVNPHGSSITSGLVNIPFFSSMGLLYLTSNYTEAFRFLAVQDTAERYTAGAQLPIGYTYASIGAGVLVGYYSASGDGSLTSGVFGTNKKILLESAWLGGDGYAYFAFKNMDSTANGEVDLKVAFYE